MFNGQITHLGDTPNSETVQAAIKLAEGLRGQKEAAGMTSVLKGYDLPDGTQVYVADLSDVWTVQIIPPPVPPAHSLDQPQYPDFPLAEPLPIISFISGAVTTGVAGMVDIQVPDGEGGFETVSVFSVVNPWHTVKRVTGGAARPRTAELFPDVNEAGAKLGVHQFGAFAIPGDDTPRTQFQSHDPGLFTGMMASVVQLLLGVGNLLQRDYEQRLIEREEHIDALIEESLIMALGDETLETDIREVQTVAREAGQYMVQLLYDYRWFRTHGIVWGSRVALDFAPEESLIADPTRTREPFLVELSGRGVLAMPLPRDAASFYPEVRAQYLRVFPELDQYKPFRELSLFDGLGGFPTGASIPGAKEDFDRAVRAGVVIKADEDLSRFYSGGALYSGHGWAFADNGRKAINVCRRWRNGFQYGECWEVEFSINQRANIEFNPQAEMVIQRLGLTDPVEVYKAHRLTDDDMLYIFTLKDNHKSEYEAFDELEVTPDWTISASLVMLRSGSISVKFPSCESGMVFGGIGSYAPGFGYSLTGGQPNKPIDPCEPVKPAQFKVFEPLWGGVTNVDFSVHPAVRANVPDADGPIFATYVRNRPEILHLSMGDVSFNTEYINTRRRCQFAGNWRSGHRATGSRTNGNFYSTTHDFRQADSITSYYMSETTGRILGFENYAENCHWFGMNITMSVHAYATTSSTWESVNSRSRDVSVMCAANNRSAYFVCEQVLNKGKRSGSSTGGKIFIGRTGVSLIGILWNFLMHWVGCGMCDTQTTPGPTLQECGRRQNSGCGAVLWPDMAPPLLSYSVHGGTWQEPFRVSGETNGAAIGSAGYGGLVTAPPASSTSNRESDDINYKIYGMGLPEMNGRVIHERSYTEWADEGALEFGYSGSVADWWRCAMPECPVDPWIVVRNHYGQPFVTTNSEIVWGDTVEYGKKPELAGGMGRILFGVVGQ